MAELVCWNCGGSLDDIPRPISRHTNCSHCGEVLHCCRMCRAFDTNRPGGCDEDRAEPPVDKESANFCEFFQPVNRFRQASAARARGAKSELDALFGDANAEQDGPTGDGSTGDSGNPLDDLFND